MKVDKFTIYCHTNKVNGKRYVGQTLKTMRQRWITHVHDTNKGRGCPMFGAAIRKYGADAFTHEVLETVASKKEANLAEAKWISDLQTRSPHGYNITLGGGGPDYLHEETRRKIGEITRERLRAMAPEDREAFFAKNIRVWTNERREAVRARTQSDENRKKVTDDQKRFWSQLSPEERHRRARHMIDSIPMQQRRSRTRKAWANATPEARAVRIRNAANAFMQAWTPERSARLRARNKAIASARTPEQRSAIGKKAAETVRAKGIHKGPPRMVLEQEVLERAIEMRTTGMSVSDIAATLNSSKAVLWRSIPKLTSDQLKNSAKRRWATRVAKYGSRGRKPSLFPEDLPFVRHWLDIGYSVADIADSFKVSTSEVEKAVA